MPHDEGGLIRELGGDDATVKKLDAMFEFDNSKLDYSHAEDIAGLIGQYIHGNEPSHHVAYMYNYAGHPWRTQERLKQIVDSQYKPTPDGLSGNDDLGQMRSEEHTSELQSLMRNSYAVFCLKKKKLTQLKPLE